MNPYAEAIAWTRNHPGTGSATSLGKLILSLYNSSQAFGIGECLGNLDSNLIALSLRMVQHYVQHGEDDDLRAAGEEICKAMPRLWDIGEAGDDAKHAKREQFHEADRQAARDEARKALDQARQDLVAESDPDRRDDLRVRIANLEDELR